MCSASSSCLRTGFPRLLEPPIGSIACCASIGGAPFGHLCEAHNPIVLAASRHELAGSDAWPAEGRFHGLWPGSKRDSAPDGGPESMQALLAGRGLAKTQLTEARNDSRPLPVTLANPSAVAQSASVSHFGLTTVGNPAPPAPEYGGGRRDGARRWAPGISPTGGRCARPPPGRGLAGVGRSCRP